MTNLAGAISSEKPFAGRRIVVTRARKQAGGLAQRIEALGGEVIEFPTIEIQPPIKFRGPRWRGAANRDLSVDYFYQRQQRRFIS